MQQNQEINLNVDALSPSEMATRAEVSMIAKVNKPYFEVLLSAMYGGFFIGLAFVFYTLVTTGSGDMPYGMAKLIGGICFCLGLILVVVCGADLFTSTTMTVIAKASKRASCCQIIKNWIGVYVGNFLGAALLIAIVYASGHPWGDNGKIALNYMNIAQGKLGHTFVEAVFLGVMCNVMVCLGVWLSYSCRSTGDKVLVMLLPIAMFVACGFEHCVANMFEIPMAIILHATATPEFWLAQGIDATKYADLSLTDFILHNLIPVTIGNILGGAIIIAMGNWLLFLRPKKVANN